MNFKLVGCTVALGAVAAALLVVSPPGCGCETPDMTFRMQLSTEPPPYILSPAELNVNEVQTLAERKYVGSPLASAQAPTALRDAPCSKADSKLTCVYWTETGALRKRGLTLTLTADREGVIRTVEVAKVTSWLNSPPAAELK